MPSLFSSFFWKTEELISSSSLSRHIVISVVCVKKSKVKLSQFKSSQVKSSTTCKKIFIKSLLSRAILFLVVTSARKKTATMLITADYCQSFMPGVDRISAPVSDKVVLPSTCLLDMQDQQGFFHYPVPRCCHQCPFFFFFFNRACIFARPHFSSPRNLLGPWFLRLIVAICHSIIPRNFGTNDKPLKERLIYTHVLPYAI